MKSGTSLNKTLREYNLVFKSEGKYIHIQSFIPMFVSHYSRALV